MASIYSGCYVCLAATVSPDHDGVCAVKVDPPTRTAGTGLDGKPYCVYLRPPVPHLMNTKSFPASECFPLTTRAWVYQERRLAPRVLHFGPVEVAFECETMNICECGAANTYNGGCTKSHSGFGPIGGPEHAKAQLAGTYEQIKIAWHWRRLVQMYSGLDLTYATDRLIAFSGMARSIQELVESRLGRYCAGLWRETLMNDLLWFVGPERVGGATKHRSRTPLRQLGAGRLSSIPFITSIPPLPSRTARYSMYRPLQSATTLLVKYQQDI